MAFTTVDYAKKLMKTHELQYFRVSDASNKLTINKCDKAIGIDAAQDLLQDTIDNCEGEYVNVKLYSEKPEFKERGSLSGTIYELKIRCTNSGHANMYKSQQPIQQGINAPSWKDILDLHSQKSELDMKLKLLEMEQAKKNPMHAILEKIIANQQLMNALTAALLNIGSKRPAQHIAAPPVESSNATETMRETLETFKEVDPDYLGTLATMAKYIKKNPEVLEQIKMVINHEQK